MQKHFLPVFQVWCYFPEQAEHDTWTLCFHEFALSLFYPGGKTEFKSWDLQSLCI